MYFDGSIYPHLPKPLLERILRIRALVDHATDDLTAALGHMEAISQMSPRLIKGKGKGTQPSPPDTADDPITSVSQADLIHPNPTHTPQQDSTQQDTTPQNTTNTPHDPTNTSIPPPTSSTLTLSDNLQRLAPAPRPHQSYTCMRAANSRPINLFPSPPPTNPPQQCHPTRVYSLQIPFQGHATLAPAGLIAAIPHTFQPTSTTQPFTFIPTQKSIRPNHPEASTGPESPWWDATGSAP